MLRGTIAITLLNLAAIPRRLGSSLVIVIGIAGVVGVLISVLAMAQGFLDTLGQTGRQVLSDYASLGSELPGLYNNAASDAKTARLKALRLEKERVDAQAAAQSPETASPVRKRVKRIVV